MLPSVEVEHEAEEPADQPRAGAEEHGEPGAGEFRAALQVENPQPLGDLPVRRASRRRGRSPRADDRRGGRVARGNVREREVGHKQRLRFEHGLDIAELGLEGCDL